MFRESLERDFRNEIRDLKTEQRNMTKSIDYAHDNIEDMKKKLEQALAENALLKSDNASLRLENASLKTSVFELEHRLTGVEQYSRNVNIEIQGVVRKENESVSDLLCKLGTVIGEPLGKDDIEACHRVPSRAENKSNIVVQCLKKQLMAAARHRGCEIIGLWIRYLVGHLYFSVGAGKGNGDLAIAVWLSLLNYVQNKHTGHGLLYPKCKHGDLEPRKWIAPAYVNQLLSAVEELLVCGSKGGTDATPQPPHLSTTFGPVDKVVIVEAHRSRFVGN
ncbi:hypothetical protein MTO96_025173 [Rhipicephalus appendiculatus]